MGGAQQRLAVRQGGERETFRTLHWAEMASTPLPYKTLTGNHCRELGKYQVVITVGNLENTELQGKNNYF